MAKKLNDNLSQLKEDVLIAVLNDKPFRGGNNRLSFADLPFVLSQPVVYLVDNDVKNAITIEKLNTALQIVTEDFLKQNPEKNGKTVYFQFHSTKQGSDTILLSLDAKVYSTSNDRTSNLSSMQMTFKKEGSGWEIMDEPTSLSA